MSALTKIFIVLSLVCSLVLSVLLALFVSRQENYKLALQAEATRSAAYQALSVKNGADRAVELADFTALSNKLKTVQDDAAKATADSSIKIAELQTSLAQSKADNAQLSNTVASLTGTTTLQQNLIADMNKSLDGLRPQVSDLTTKNAQLNRLANEQKNALDAAEQAIRKLQEQIAQAEAAPKTGAASSEGTSTVSLSAGSPTNVAINGKISKTTQSLGRTLIELPLGTRDGVQVNTRFSVYRDRSFVADAVVERVSPDQSVAVIQDLKPGESVQAGDMVMSGQ